jgi:hypothetical protein
MEPSKKIRIQTSLDDLEDIQMISSMIWNGIESRFQNISQLSSDIELGWTNPKLDISDWPKKIQFTKQNPISIKSKDISSNQEINFQIIGSNIGSVTLRPLDAKKYPIFYMSLAKYSDNTYQWEDEDGNSMDPNLWQNYFQKSIINYFEKIK